ncbi:MAG: hypothetical protein JWL97_4357 [Gemmatimonadales bacterium]|jgi:hypothetical protein|nr:hypothetical protein [Gemmatimonadales bacterium]
MTPNAPQVTEFLDTRRVMAQARDTTALEQWDHQLKELAATDPETALTILTALSISDDFGAIDAAAIYTKHLFPARQEQAIDLLLRLFGDPDPEVRRQVLDTVDELTTVRPELAHIIAAE